MYEQLRISNQLCFPLYVCSKEIVRRYKPLLDEIGLTYTQYIAMMAFWERKEMNVKALGEALFLDSGTLTPVLKKLEAKGLVTRERAREDERSLRVRITPAGEALAERCKEIPAKMGACVELTAEEAATLKRILEKLQGQFAL